MPWHLYLALRHLFPRGGRVSVFTLVSVVGVALGVMILVIVLSVMGGFGSELRTKMVETYGHVRLVARDLLTEPAVWQERLEAEPGVAAVAPYAEGVVLVQHQARVTYPFIRGIDPEREARLVPLERFLLAGSLDELDDDSIIVSTGVAAAVGVRPGDEVDVYSPLILEKLRADSVLLPATLRVAAVLQTGWHPVDGNTVLVTLRRMQDLYGLGESVHGLAVRLDGGPAADVRPLLEAVGPELPYTLRLQTWLETNRDYLFVLSLEKNLMFFLLLFIVLVAGFAIFCTLFISAVRRTREIGLVSALGGRPRDVAACFCWQGFLIGVVGTALGVGLALLALHYRNDIISAFATLTGSRDALVQFYMFAELPVEYDRGDFVRIAVFSILIATLAGVIPAWRAARLNPAEALRHE